MDLHLGNGTLVQVSQPLFHAVVILLSYEFFFIEIPLKLISGLNVLAKIPYFSPSSIRKYACFFPVSGNEKWPKSLNPIAIGNKPSKKDQRKPK